MMPFATMWMDQEGIILGKINQTEREKCCVLCLIWGF